MIKFRVDKKPCSTNKIMRYFSRNGVAESYKSDEAKEFERIVEFELMRNRMKPIDYKKFEVHLKIGSSNIAGDVDNFAKNALDAISQNPRKPKNWFLLLNDNKVYRLIVEKEKVKKGEEYTEYFIKEYKEL